MYAACSTLPPRVPFMDTFRALVSAARPVPVLPCAVLAEPAPVDAGRDMRCTAREAACWADPLACTAMKSCDVFAAVFVLVAAA